MHAGEIIKNLRKSHNLTQGDFARILGVNISSIQKYESGAVSNLKMNTIRTICEQFDISPFVLVFPEKIEDVEIATRFHISEKLNIELADLNDKGIRKIYEYSQDLYDSGNYKR